MPLEATNPATTGTCHDRGPPPPTSKEACRCEQGPPAPCPAHPCPCPGCRGGRPESCRWMRKHRAAWAALGDQAPPRYLEQTRRRGLPTDSLLTTPRVRNLVELGAARFHAQGGRDIFRSDAVANISQTWGRTGWRMDGLVPTIPTCPRLFHWAAGDFLGADACAAVQGFPQALRRHALPVIPSTQQLRLVGNSMHVASMTPQAAGLLSTVRARP